MLSDATYEGEAVGDAPVMPETGFRLDSPLVAERHVIFPPFQALAAVSAGFGHNLFVLDPDGPLRHTVPFVRVGDRALPSLGLAAALTCRSSSMARRFTSTRGRCASGIAPCRCNSGSTRSADGRPQLPVEPRGLQGPGPACRPEEPSVSELRVLRSVVFGRADPRRGEAEHRPLGVQGQDRVRRRHRRRGSTTCSRRPFAGGKMPGIQVHAAVADDFLSGRFLAPAPGVDAGVHRFVFALVVGVVSTLLPAWWASAATHRPCSGCSGGWRPGCSAAGYWLNVTQPVLASAVSLFGGVAYQVLRRRSREAQDEAAVRPVRLEGRLRLSSWRTRTSRALAVNVVR